MGDSAFLDYDYDYEQEHEQDKQHASMQGLARGDALHDVSDG